MDKVALPSTVIAQHPRDLRVIAELEVVRRNYPSPLAHAREITSVVRYRLRLQPFRQVE